MEEMLWRRGIELKLTLVGMASAAASLVSPKEYDGASQVPVNGFPNWLRGFVEDSREHTLT